MQGGGCEAGSRRKGKRIKMRHGRGRGCRPLVTLCYEASARLALFDKEDVKQHKMSENNDGMHLRSSSREYYSSGDFQYAPVLGCG